MQVTLALYQAARVQAKFCLAKFPAIIGCSALADVQLIDPFASRFHCMLDLADGTLMVRDLASRHGTFINGCGVAEAPLLPGDQLTVGLAQLRIAYPWYSLAPPPPTIYAASPCSLSDADQPRFLSIVAAALTTNWTAMVSL